MAAERLAQVVDVFAEEDASGAQRQIGRREEIAAAGDKVSPIARHRASVAQLKVMWGSRKPVIGPATSGRTRWLNSSYGLFRRFNLPVDILTNDNPEAARTGNWFLETNLVIDRLVKRSCNEEAVSVSCLIRPGLTPWRRSEQPRNTSRADVVPATCSVPSTPEVHPSRAFTASNISSARSIGGPSGYRIARTLPPTVHAGLQRLSRRDSGTSPNCFATSSAVTIEPSSTTCAALDHAGPVKRVATSVPMSFVATMVDFRLVGL